MNLFLSLSLTSVASMGKGGAVDYIDQIFSAGGLDYSLSAAKLGSRFLDSDGYAWQQAAPSLTGVVMFTAINAENPLQWAHSNAASQRLQFVPDQPL